MIPERWEEELALLRTTYHRVEFVSAGSWVLVEPVPLTNGWNRTSASCCFRIPVGYPGVPPYGFYVPADLRVTGGLPGSYQPKPDPSPPFEGEWGMLSWAHESDGWTAGAE